MDFAQLAGGDQMPIALEGLVHPLEGVKYVLLQTLILRHLQALVAIQALPEVEGGRENHVRIANNVHELGLGKKLQ